MKSTLLIPTHPLLKKYIEYFLFFESTRESISYKTYPNTNFCLALYEGNKVIWDKKTNICTISDCDSTYSSKLFGLHKKPFQVNCKGTLNQICILFSPEGLSYFTQHPLCTIDLTDNPVKEIFGIGTNDFLERLFSTQNRKEQQIILETFLLKKLKPPKKIEKFIYTLYQLQMPVEDKKLKIQDIANDIGVSQATLYRQFVYFFGQSPQYFRKIVQFRRALEYLLTYQKNITEVAYKVDFYDQSHLIKDFKRFTEKSPLNLLREVTVEHEKLVWTKRD